MTAMTDPHDGLVSFQAAFDNDELDLLESKLFDDLYVLRDEPNGNPRFTFALIENNVVKATAVFIIDEALNGLPCFGLGYSVATTHRGKGLGFEVVEKSLTEFTTGIKEHIPAFYIETLVSVDNIPSQKISEKHISKESKKTTDKYSKKPALHYAKLFN